MVLKEYLFLFDIDGTILDIRGDGKKALIRAIELSLDIIIKDEISLLGGIDYVFFKHYFDEKGLPISQFNEYWKKFESIYIELMNGYEGHNWRVFPDSIKNILFLSEVSNMALATGNIKSGAMIKLRHFSLDSYFSTGGFGDKAENRSDMVKEAISSAESFYNKKFDKKKIYLLGDTQKDMASAVENGINPVLMDPDSKNKNNAKKWEAKFYGNFTSFDNFLSIIKNPSMKKEIVFF